LDAPADLKLISGEQRSDRVTGMLDAVMQELAREGMTRLKNITLVSVIGVPELLLTTETLTSATFRVFELYSVVALYYLTLTTLWGVMQAWIERRFSEPTTKTVVEAGFRERLLGSGFFGAMRKKA
jgi:polar amino acid transport system permease protein